MTTFCDFLFTKCNYLPIAINNYQMQLFRKTIVDIIDFEIKKYEENFNFS